MALTDHDTVEGCARTAAACGRAGIEFITGTELTAEHDGNELHMLGYFIDTNTSGCWRNWPSSRRCARIASVKWSARLNTVGIPLQAEAVFALANCRAPGRPHVARALVQEGFCADLDEAFERFLKKGKPAWVPKFKMSAARSHRVDPPGRRSGGHGASRAEPHR